MLLKVHNFVCLKDVEIEIDDITFIIGEQASGKSLLCKLYFYFREIFSNISFLNSIVDDIDINEYLKSAIKNFYDIFPKSIWEGQGFSAQLIIDERIDIKIIYESQQDLKIILSQYMIDNLEAIRRDFNKKMTEDIAQVLNSAFIFKDIVIENNASSLFEAVKYIPSGRAFFSTVADNVFGLLSEDMTIDPFLKNFGKQYEKAKRDKLDAVIQEVDDLTTFILKGEVLIDKKDTWLVSQGVKRSLNYTSSGQQEALPLLLVLRHLMIRKPFWGTQSAIIEEPEAHLFPTSQKAMIDLLFLVKKNSESKHFIVTTHSPYILSCANNALLRNPDIKVNAYYLVNGCIKRIIDDESDLIDGIDLDAISDVIADEFDEIIQGKYKNG